ncbi:nucleobase:cation symporter-2 family protein [Aerococcus suis]|uniref:Xanthine permease n=1 Tax=Aerococcus suis TaxID=371602 RepID=A0A1W1ZDP0_9LACT|nr:nucleobase:cation symporter-2 family protein [Aerococcus suis]SMC46560.1 xanthine permease [Aerococcus suis]
MKNFSFKEMWQWKNITLSIQHLLAMYAGAVVVPILIAGAWKLNATQTAYMVAADIAICGLATLLQVYRGRVIGIGLPVVLASTFTGVAPMIQIGSTHGPGVAFGSLLVAGIIMLFLAPAFAKLNRLFPPLVTRLVVALIGITLIPVAITNWAGGDGAADFGSLQNLIVGFITLVIILIIYRFTKGFVQSISTLIGMVTGTICAAFLGMVDLSALQSASWFQLPMPFALATPEVDFGSVITLTVVGIVTFIEATGNYFGLLEDDERLSEGDLRRGYLSVGLSFILAGLFNTTPQTAFSQNLGVIKVSGVRKREVIANLVVIMLLLGFVPKLGVLATMIPKPVLGGAMVFLFGNVLAFGIGELGSMSLSDDDSMIIAASIAVGLGVAVMPEAFSNLPAWLSWITTSGTVAGTIVAVLLNLFFNGLSEKS